MSSPGIRKAGPPRILPGPLGRYLIKHLCSRRVSFEMFVFHQLRRSDKTIPDGPSSREPSSSARISLSEMAAVALKDHGLPGIGRANFERMNHPMEAAVFLDHKFVRTPDGEVWATTMFGPTFWTRYLEVFSKVHVVARLQARNSAPESATCVSSPEIEFAETPYYEGPHQFWKVRSEIRAIARSLVESDRAVILRVPQTIPFQALPQCLELGIPYGAEIVADPWDLFSPGAIRHPGRPFFRHWFTRELRRACRHAVATSYVTAESLQRRYPPADGTFTQGVSDVEIEELLSAPRTAEHFRKERVRCISVGAFNQLYKAQDILIRAVGRALRDGLPIELIIVGEGKFRSRLEKLARQTGFARRIEFTGQLSSGFAVREQLDRADLFLLPSRQEGLPRALVEAMARGLPAIASNVGGIPELLEEECLVNPNDVSGLARKIRRFVGDPDFLAAQSKRNLAVAERFAGMKLHAERRDFLQHIFSATRDWCAEKKRLS